MLGIANPTEGLGNILIYDMLVPLYDARQKTPLFCVEGSKRFIYVGAQLMSQNTGNSLRQHAKNQSHWKCLH
jgi:hypothetical protein